MYLKPNEPINAYKKVKLLLLSLTDGERFLKVLIVSYFVFSITTPC